ncbi:hypothetical protein [Erwinia tasmaniensis]|uniref:Tox-PLDMTX domain-containing protein n=1 Tax=Erwinia tasmaniensis (strain DSM 17950 / CFBP 7177 / CIP 109463 / NCPPB 4357 / Et1/99) TaxID=465817 RepID=B2VCT8_ERWT9|nr:hypothetical protein [Erwinia tasmaniensis]CAO98039.1 Hypothetical protein ETA_29930 [Erwinia tasmaniensis Et1/99]
MLQIQNDERFPQRIRNNAYLARIGARLLVPVDIKGYRLNNTLFLPDSRGSKTGVIIRLDSEIPYYYVDEGKDLSENIRWALPYKADERKREGVMNYFTWFNIFYITPSGVDILFNIIDGTLSFEENFNFNNPDPMDIASLSANLADTMEADYKLKGHAITNRLLISRAIAGAHIPDLGVTATEAEYHHGFTWHNMTPAEYLRSFTSPFSTLSGEMQLVSSSIKGETVQETELHAHQAEYIGSWVDATIGAITSFTPAGWVLNTAQSAADIAADLTEGKEPDPLAVAGLVVGCIPGDRIAAKVGKFTRIGGKAVKYGMMLGNKAVDLSIVAESIKTAVGTGEPLAIYQALLASGMSVKNAYDMAKHMSSALKLGKTMEESAALEELDAIHNNIPESSLSSTMPERKFIIGSTEMLGKINNGEIEISRDKGATWNKGSKLHLLAFRLQNSGGGRRLIDWIKSKADINEHRASSPTWEPLPPNSPERSIEPTLERYNYKDLSLIENWLIKETSTLLKKNLGHRYNKYVSNPHENCANAAIEVAKELRDSRYTDVKIIELGIWPNGGVDTFPTNHYVVTAKKYGIEISVDLTAGQFEQYGFSGPIITTKDSWIYQWQQNMKEKPRLLVKMAPLSRGISTSPFSMNYINPQLTVPNGTLLQRPSWYK